MTCTDVGMIMRLPKNLPILGLPTITYVAIPPFAWMNIFYIAYHPESFYSPKASWADFHISAIEIGLWALGMLLVGLPVAASFIRGIFLRITRKQIGGNYWSEWFWILSMFRLPEPLHGKHHWFAWVYYLSILAFPIIVIGVGCSISMMRP